MDLFNNSVGIAYGQSISPLTWNSTIADAIWGKVIDGALKYLTPLDFSISPRWPTGLNGIMTVPTFPYTEETKLKWTNQ